MQVPLSKEVREILQSAEGTKQLQRVLISGGNGQVQVGDTTYEVYSIGTMQTDDVPISSRNSGVEGRAK
ncbi:MAG TPA: hypothetical protein VF707_19875 [Ardenticatenaceae bacterium]|jgi:hypothetical protein